MAIKVLLALDTARTQYYHFKMIAIAGMGLFTDAYVMFCITPAAILIGRLHYADEPATKPSFPPLPVIALVGNLIGQLMFGWLGDRMGRKRVYGLTLFLMVLGSVGSGLPICRTGKCVLNSLYFFRFFLGVGIGGDYSLSATIMSEYSNKMRRGSFMAAVFSMQGFGILASSAVTMMICTIFDHISRGNSSSDSDIDKNVDWAWRLILMSGAIPAALTFYWRMTMPETARYTALVEQNISQAEEDMKKVFDLQMDEIPEEVELEVIPPNPPSYGILSKQFFRFHGRDLFACAAFWFLLDFVFYSCSVSQFYVTNPFVPDSMNAYQEAFTVAMLHAMIVICSAIPGYWTSVFLIDRIGRVKIQMMGFFFMTICLFALAISYEINYWRHHNNVGFMLLSDLILFFANLGPKVTTFIVPAELFRARFRCTCHGISGAAGKVGAIVGATGLLWVPHIYEPKKDERLRNSLLALAGVCAMGMVLTYFFTPETKGRSLEADENEHEDGSTSTSPANARRQKKTEKG